MMQSICKYTSIPLHSETITNGLGISGKDSIVPSAHPLFSKPLALCISAATSKPAHKLSALQRYLLFVVLAKHTGLLEIRHPITPAELPDRTCLSLLPALIAACIKIQVSSREWAELASILPRMQFRKDNRHGFAWDYLVKQCILKHTAYLSTTNPKAQFAATLVDPRVQDIPLTSEHALFHTIQGTISKKAALSFGMHHIQTTLTLMHETMLDVSGAGLSSTTKERILRIFATPPERQTILAKEAINVRKAIVHWLDGAIEETSIVFREAYYMSLQRLDQIIKALSDKATMFDSVLVEHTKPTPQFSIQATTTQVEHDLITLDEIARLRKISPKLAALAERKRDAQLALIRAQETVQEAASVEKITDLF